MIIYGKNATYKAFTQGENELYTLLDFAEKYGISGNLIKAKIAWLIMTDENPFSLSAERSDSSGSAQVYAKRDIAELCRLFFISPSDEILENYVPINNRVSGEEKRIGK